MLGFKAQSLWGQVQTKSNLNQMQREKQEGKTGVTGEKPLGAEKRTNKLNPHMAPSLEIKPGLHWWG